MVREIKRYILDDMAAIYYMDSETRNVEFMLLPNGMEPVDWTDKNQQIDSLIQIKLIGDEYTGSFAGGMTMRQSESVKKFQYEGQEVEQKMDGIAIVTILKDHRGFELKHCLNYKNGSKAVICHTEFVNKGEQNADLEMISSFSLGGLSPFLKGDGAERLVLHRIRSVWSMEGRHETSTIEDLQLEPSWAMSGVRAERFGQAGSMTVNGFFPFAAVEDTEQGVLWGAQLAHNASWQMELYRKDEGLAFSGGLADREFGHWRKIVHPGEGFTTPIAILSVCRGGGIDTVTNRIVSALEPIVDKGPECEQELPILFNEYCTSWGSPSEEAILKQLEVVKDKGISYFVIDCGWFRKNGVPWDISMGDYEVSKELFPEGLGKTVEAIKEAGLKPGLWFEIETVGRASKAYHKEEHLLKRDGVTLTTTMRRFFDMRHPWVQDYLEKKVIGTLKENGFEYIKVDYNDTIGIGCDGAESLGEGLRQNVDAVCAFLYKIKDEVPGIVIENCASGGHRIEPKMMSICAMASFSDAHECEEIPIIAANLHRVMLPRQSQIWAVIRKQDSPKRIAYSIINTFLGRMCLSGDVMNLTDTQWALIEQGIAFYKKIAPIIKQGESRRYGTNIRSYRHPKGWQGVLRIGNDKRAVAIYHVFNECQEQELVIPLNKGYEIVEMYSDTEAQIRIEKDKLILSCSDQKKAVAVLLKER